MSATKRQKRTSRNINTLLKEIQRTPFTGIFSPEALWCSLSGLWFRRINLEGRLVYKAEDDTVIILLYRKQN